ncbi:WW domain-binding protein 11-like [Sarcophilus harrisii]|uniref:WW domain-binding protein 11-like n=1 Tax=Sarcophilus harrisii TaxID=9305 RepID=UPI001301B1CC|nr:WW domain-binding protein 11-like [Sarcophilus harrisii]
MTTRQEVGLGRSTVVEEVTGQGPGTLTAPGRELRPAQPPASPPPRAGASRPPSADATLFLPCSRERLPRALSGPDPKSSPTAAARQSGLDPDPDPRPPQARIVSSYPPVAPPRVHSLSARFPRPPGRAPDYNPHHAKRTKARAVAVAAAGAAASGGGVSYRAASGAAVSRARLASRRARRQVGGGALCGGNGRKARRPVCALAFLGDPRREGRWLCLQGASLVGAATRVRLGTGRAAREGDGVKRTPLPRSAVAPSPLCGRPFPALRSWGGGGGAPGARPSSRFPAPPRGPALCWCCSGRVFLGPSPFTGRFLPSPSSSLRLGASVAVRRYCPGFDRDARGRRRRPGILRSLGGLHDTCSLVIHPAWQVDFIPSWNKFCPLFFWWHLPFLLAGVIPQPQASFL